MAGEIVDLYDDKIIHIIHNRETLCDPKLSAKFHRNMLEAVNKKGINVILGERANMDELDVSTLLLDFIPGKIFGLANICPVVKGKFHAT